MVSLESSLTPDNDEDDTLNEVGKLWSASRTDILHDDTGCCAGVDAVIG